MSDLNSLLKEMDFKFLSSGEHGMSIEGMRKVLGNDHFVFLDVRTDEEVKYLSFPFALHIPMNELPDRLGEVPKDKFIIPFCSSVFRGALVYIYLRANGYEEVKGLTASSEDMAATFKPGTDSVYWQLMDQPLLSPMKSRLKSILVLGMLKMHNRALKLVCPNCHFDTS